MPRYVILRHELPVEANRPSHYDVMFDTEAALRTWAVVAPPDANDEQPAEQLPDHRREYLNYEGPVSGNRGTVTRWDEGTYEVRRDDAEALVVEVRGTRLHGGIIIRAVGVYWYVPSEPRKPVSG